MYPSIGKRVGSVHFCPVNTSVTMHVSLRAMKILNKEQHGLPRGENGTLVSNCKMLMLSVCVCVSISHLPPGNTRQAEVLKPAREGASCTC